MNSCNSKIYDNSCNFPSSEFPVAMGYVPWQKWEKPYDLHRGFQIGTIFPSLDKPFLGKRGNVS